MVKITAVPFTILISFVLSACGGDGDTASTDNQAEKAVAVKPPQPVELTVTYAGGNKNVFDQRFGNKIREKFPHFTLNYLDTTRKMPEVIATNPKIDLMVASTGAMYSYLLAYGLQSDISDLVEKHQYDLSRINPNLLAELKQVGNGAIYGFPWTNVSLGLFYNKDLFDKFGVPYPKDGMTWDELYELARTMSRTEGDRKYRGLTMEMGQVASLNSLSAKLFDTAAHKPRFTADDVSRVFRNAARFLTIVGNEPPDTSNTLTKVRDLFIKEQTTAMHIESSGFLGVLVSSGLRNWDIASFPVFPERPKVGPAASPDFVFITSTSQNRDAAFQALAYLTSEEYQTWMAQTLGYLPMLSDPKQAMSHFGESIPGAKQKNIKALLPEKFAEGQATYKYFPFAQGEMRKALSHHLSGKDINTALREANERMEQFIAKDQAKK